MPDCLQALARADPAYFAQVLAVMEKDHAATPEAATQLLSWLNQIGRSAEAVKWMQTLPAAAMQRPPLVVAAAEALRQTGDWPALQAWTDQKDWGPDVDFLRWAYGMHAAHQLNNPTTAEALWRTLESHAQRDGVHALFAAATIYSWGRTTEAEALWWQAATHDGQIAIDALGSLARHYQRQRDADGQYRVFRQLHALRPQDADIGNNFAFFATLTGREQRQTQQIIQANLALAPQQPAYLATAAFMLFMQNRSAESLALLQPHVAEVSTSLPLKFAYGLALAGTGEKITARTFLDALPPASLTEREVEIIKAALAPR
jgi:tetratricopeptide (TPR) repeat protein